MIKKIVLTVLIGYVASLSYAGGLILTMDNDLFNFNDNNYSHGTEIAWATSRNDGGVINRYDYGINQLMYTPEDIRIATNQPGDHPWVGTLTVFQESWRYVGKDLVRSRISVGVLGPSSGAEQSQKIVHKIVGSAEPMGWDNQLKDEPILNYMYERYHPLLQFGREPSIRFVNEAIYGGNIGTTFIDAKVGTDAKLGWIPKSHMQGGIAPKAIPSSKFFGYVYGRVDGIYEIHNATIGDSYFHNELEGRVPVPLVGEVNYGTCIGYKGFAITYQKSVRTREFERQPSMMDWGMIRLEFSVPY
jgi:lipid A 3-O-deacylase